MQLITPEKVAITSCELAHGDALLTAGSTILQYSSFGWDRDEWNAELLLT